MNKTNSDNPLLSLIGDRACITIKDDAFGLIELATALADVLKNRISADGYVIGLEGRWGSGKSTLINFIDEKLSEDPRKQQVIIRFSPWEINDKTFLLRIFFDQIARQIEGLKKQNKLKIKLGDAGRTIIDRLVFEIGQYSSYFEIFAATATSSAATMHLAAPVAQSAKISALMLTLAAKLSKLLQKDIPSLDDLKDKISKDLKALGKLLPDLKIIVVIDDLDRLEATESIEMLRLVKAVANFPLLVYVLCFDRQLLLQHLKSILPECDPKGYLEKIFQQIVTLPPQEPFALRRFFVDKLTKTFPDEMLQKSFNDYELGARTQALFDIWCGKLIETPRNTNLISESIKFGWPYMKGKVDFYDFVWLQLIKISSLELYDWIKRYVTELGSYRDNGRPGNLAAKSMAIELTEIMDSLGWGEKNLPSLNLFLPGVQNYRGRVSGAGTTEGHVFDFEGTNELNVFEDSRRLGSPSHWRMYFSFDHPSYALKDENVDEFLFAAQSNQQEATKILRELLRKPHETTGHFLNLLLDRLIGRKEPYPAELQYGIASAFADMMDEVPRDQARLFMGNDPWRRALSIFSSQLSPFAERLFANGQSINWLAFFLRDQAFTIGRIDPNRRNEERRIFSAEAFEIARLDLYERIKLLSLEAILKLPEPATVLFFWEQLCDREALYKLLKKECKPDEVFLQFLEALQNLVVGSNGSFMRLSVHVVSQFLNPNETRKRLSTIANGRIEGLATRAKELIKSLNPNDPDE